DFVVASEVVEHLTDVERARAYRAVAGILKPGGHFIGTVPLNENLEANLVVCPDCGHHFHRWGHQKSFTVETLRSELSQCFRPEVVTVKTFVDFKRRGLAGKLKSSIRLVLGHFKQPLAHPNIYFCA